MKLSGIIIYGMLFMLALVSQSCKKCQECTFIVSGGVQETEKFCEKDFDSKQEYEDYIRTIESKGGDCQ